jgi:hypothetical protein
VKTEKTWRVLVICEVGRLSIALKFIVITIDCKGVSNKSNYQSKSLYYVTHIRDSTYTELFPYYYLHKLQSAVISRVDALYFLGFEVMTAMIMKGYIIWNITEE